MAEFLAFLRIFLRCIVVLQPLRLGLLGTLNVMDAHEVYARDISAAVKFIYAKLGPLDQAKHIGGHYPGIP